MWSDAAPPASPSGRCRWACRRWAWKRTDAPDIWGRWSAGRVDAAATWQTFRNGERRKKKKITHHFYWIVIHFQSSFILFPTCLAGRGISVSCMTPAMRKPFPLAPQPLVGLKDLWHLTTQSGQMLLGHVVTLMGVFDGDPPGLKRTMARRQPSSVLSISMSFILDTSSVRTLHDRKAANMETKRRSQEVILHLFATYLSKIEPTPALWALLRWTWRPVASRMPSFTVTERCEKEAMRSSFQPEYKGKHSDSHSTYF